MCFSKLLFGIFSYLVDYPRSSGKRIFVGVLHTLIYNIVIGVISQQLCFKRVCSIKCYIVRINMSASHNNEQIRLGIKALVHLQRARNV